MYKRQLLDSEDWFGVTVTGNMRQSLENEPNASEPWSRVEMLALAHKRGINTWVSFEPVYDPKTVYDAITVAEYIDLYKIGKLNYYPSNINWTEFGRECEWLCKKYGRSYYIKDDLLREMEATARLPTRLEAIIVSNRCSWGCVRARQPTLRMRRA